MYVTLCSLFYLNSRICSCLKRETRRANEREQTRKNGQLALTSCECRPAANTHDARVGNRWNKLLTRVCSRSSARSGSSFNLFPFALHSLVHVYSRTSSFLARQAGLKPSVIKYEWSNMFEASMTYERQITIANFNIRVDWSKTFTRARSLVVRIRPRTHAYTCTFLTKLHRAFRWRPRRSFLFIFFLLPSSLRFIEV